MEIIADREKLAKAVTVASRATPARAPFPSLAGVLLSTADDGVRLSATNLTWTVETSSDVQVVDEGSVLIPARLLADITKSLPGSTVTLASNGDDSVVVSSGRSRFDVRTFPAEDFPTLPTACEDQVVVDTAVLGSTLPRVVPAAAKDDTRPDLCGVLFQPATDGGLNLVATDSYRLVRSHLPSNMIGERKVVVPIDAVAEMTRLLSQTSESKMMIGLGGNQIQFVLGDTRLTAQLVAGGFPSYERLIPDSQPHRIIIDREALKSALGRARLLVSDATTPVRLGFVRDGVNVSVLSRYRGSVSDGVDAEYDDIELSIGFNPSYLADGLEMVGTARVEIEFTDSLKPITMRPVGTNEDFLYLLMPVRV